MDPDGLKTSTGSQKITGWYIWNDENLPTADGKGQVLLQDYPMYHWVIWRNSPVMIRGMILQAGEIRIGEIATRNWNQVTNLLGKWCEILDLTRFIKKRKTWFIHPGLTLTPSGALNTQLTFPPVGVFCFWLDTYTGLYWLVVSIPLISQIGSSSQLSGTI
jgi:hypothetical protein